MLLAARDRALEPRDEPAIHRFKPGPRPEAVARVVGVLGARPENSFAKSSRRAAVPPSCCAAC
jgi:hypothetical protein